MEQTVINYEMQLHPPESMIRVLEYVRRRAVTPDAENATVGWDEDREAWIMTLLPDQLDRIFYPMLEGIEELVLVLKGGFNEIVQ